MSREQIVCVGAGPKSIAIALLARVLEGQGVPAPRVRIVEQRSIGANWAGTDGYTDGVFPLDTSPFKDVGFPYESGFGPEVDHELGHYSFVESLKARGEYARWVSRGKFKVSHAEFARYLRWVAQSAELEIVRGRVRHIECRDGRTLVTVASERGDEVLDAAGVVVTGPGDAVPLPRDVRCMGQVFDGKSYWLKRASLRELPPGRVAVVGGGQSAATAAKSVLLETRHEVDMVNRRGMLIAQSTGFTENHLCTDPGDRWAQLSRDERLDILERINNGVVDVELKRELDQNDRVRMTRGAVQRIQFAEGRSLLELDGGETTGPYVAIVLALGFDPLARLRKFMSLPDSPECWEDVDHHLRLRDLKGNVHVPALAALAQGPGFSLLSCLGRVAARVLSCYVRSEPVGSGNLEEGVRDERDS